MHVIRTEYQLHILLLEQLCEHIVHIDLQSFKVIVTYIRTYLPYRMPIVYISYLVYLSIKIISMLK